MTRINLVDPSTLHTKHLVAEYRELPRVFGLVEAAQRRGLTPATAKIPKHFVLGPGHVTFFYDKLKFLADRFHWLVNEGERRGFNFSHTNIKPIQADDHWWNDWTPRPEDIKLSEERIAARMPKDK